MLTMTKACRQWILLLIIGSAIGGILAVPNTTDTTKPALNNGSPYPPGGKEVPSVEPLPETIPSPQSSKEHIFATTIRVDVSKHPLNENKVLSTTDNTRYDGEPEEYLPSTGTMIKGEASSVKSIDDGRGNLENRATYGSAEARSLNGNDVAVVVDEKTDMRNSLHGNITDLSDVSMDYDYKDTEGGERVASKNASLPAAPGLVARCTHGNETYAPGATVSRNCEDQCVCGGDGNWVNCEPLCVSPFVRAGRGIQDALCQEKLIPEKPCCATLVCVQDSEPEPEEYCHLGNKTVPRGDTLEDGCSKVCVCEAQGMLKCRPRCPASNSTSTSMAATSANQRDKCVPVPDPRDPCCTITLCDVTLGDLDQFKPDFPPAEANVKLDKVVAVNSTAIKLVFSNNPKPEPATVQLSTDNLLWRERKLGEDGIVGNLQPSHTYYVRVGDEKGQRPGASMRVTTLPAGSSTGLTTGNNGNRTDVSLSGDNDRDGVGVCNHRGKTYKVGAEWYDECISFCTCSLVGNNPETECATIECPTDFGLDVLDPNCLDWDWVPEDFVPSPPHCCSQEVRCRNNGSCLYEGKSYDNWSEIPSNVTGCEKRCYCELGNVSCHSACQPVTALPPTNLKCPPSHATLTHLPDDDCCLHWACGDPSTASIPTNFGRNGTTTFPGPLATDSINQLESIDDKKIPGKSGSGDQRQGNTFAQGLTDRYAAVPPRKYHESTDLHSRNHPDATDEREQIHYPMDPGHPTTITTTTPTTTTTTTTTTTVIPPPPPPPPPYQGPYNPNFTPTQLSIEDVFRLTPRTHPKTNPFQASKERPKSKTESKKPIELAKPFKDASSALETYHAPAIPTEKRANLSQYVLDATLAPSPYPTNRSSSFTQPLQENTYQVFMGQNRGESVVPHFQFHREYDGPVPYGAATGPDGANTVLSGERQNNNLGMREPGVTFDRDNEAKPQRPPQPPSQVYLGNSRPNLGPAPNRPPLASDHDLPEELYRLINLQHPGLIRLNEDPPEGHQGLYGAIHPGQGDNEHEGIGQVDGPHHPGSLQYYNPQIFAETVGDYGGANDGYHVHRGPAGARQQIEELLLRVGEKDPNTGPFRRYPGQEPIAQKPAIIAPPRVIVPHHVPQNSGRLTRLNHPFAGPTTVIHDVHSMPGPDHGLPPGFPVHGGQGVQSPSDQITVQTLEAMAENRVRLVFTVPHVFVGLHGRVEVRYTREESNVDPATWKSQIFAPPDDLIATPQLEFELGDLTPSTEYKVMVTVKLRDLSNSPTSKTYKVTTLEAPITDVVTLPPQIPTDAELTVAEVNSTWARLVWTKFTEYELQFIDGVQLRYKETEGKVYAATPLIHRAVTSYVIENLKPSVTYQVGIYFVPFPGQTTELVAENPINFTTSAEPDPYSFDIKVEIKGIKPTEVEVAWKGVPYPEDKYVNIYRAIYQSDTGKEDTSTFKIAKRDSPARTLIGELKPGTRYRLWIEVYLTNGRIKKSNVQDFVTKPGVPLSAGVLQQQGKYAAQVPLHEGDYYGPLVIVAIVASLAILSTLILLMMLMKRRSSSKADISPRKATAAYDNPSYKTCEDVATTTSCNGQKTGSATITLRDHEPRPK